MPHAQLFTGDPGYGGLPLAIEFALSVLNDNNNIHLYSAHISESRFQGAH